MGGKININAEQVLTFCVVWLITTAIMEVCKNLVKEGNYERKHRLNKRKHCNNSKR